MERRQEIRPEISLEVLFQHPISSCPNSGLTKVVPITASTPRDAFLLAENQREICDCGTDYKRISITVPLKKGA